MTIADTLKISIKSQSSCMATIKAAMNDDDKHWADVKAKLIPWTIVHGTVQRHHPFGIFVEIPGIPFHGLVQIVDFKDEGRMTADQFPPLGSDIKAVVLAFRDSNKQLWLGMKPSQLAQGRLPHEHS